jgi:hypothetical protein
VLLVPQVLLASQVLLTLQLRRLVQESLELGLLELLTVDLLEPTAVSKLRFPPGPVSVPPLLPVVLSVAYYKFVEINGVNSNI